MREIAQPLFDTIYLPSQLAGQRATGFVFPINTMVPVKYGTHVKTEDDTNLLMACMLDVPKTFLIEGIECYFVDDEGIIPARSRWYAESSITVSVGLKSYLRVPIGKCAAMAAITSLSKETLISKDDFEELRAESKLKQPIEIRQQEYFKVDASFSDWCMDHWEDRSAPSKLVVYLNGLMRVPEL